MGTTPNRCPLGEKPCPALWIARESHFHNVSYASLLVKGISPSLRQMKPPGRRRRRHSCNKPGQAVGGKKLMERALTRAKLSSAKVSGFITFITWNVALCNCCKRAC